MVLNFDEDLKKLELRSVASVKDTTNLSDKSLLDSDDEEPNNESYWGRGLTLGT